MHYVIIIIIIIVIVFYQVKIFTSTISKLKDYDSIFSKNAEDYELLKDRKLKELEEVDITSLKKMLINVGENYSECYYTEVDENSEERVFFDKYTAKEKLKIRYNSLTGISCENKNPIYLRIQKSINNYLLKNDKGVSDFHLMKDIVDRNCDAVDEEIQTQIPIPLYLGLVGTMAGILVGIGYLWLSGGLNDLLNAGNGASGAEGVEALLGGVALAMISSILGILLTTIGSLRVKNVKFEFEKNKHLFLSWIQEKLLPSLSNDVAQTLEKMSQNLVNFNSTFKSNTTNLGSALSKVNESYKLQKELISEVNQINEGRLATANLKLLNRFIECSDQIGTLGTYLQNVNSYLENVRDLNTKLDEYENRTQFIENASKFYAKHENWLTENIEEANRAMKDAIEKYNNTASNSLLKIQESMETQIKNFGEIIQSQHEKLAEKSKEVDNIVTELQNLTAIKDSIAKFGRVTSEQNEKISELANYIKEFVKEKTLSGEVKVVQHIPRSIKILAIVGISIMLFSGLLYILPIIWEWIIK